MQLKLLQLLAPLWLKFPDPALVVAALSVADLDSGCDRDDDSHLMDSSVLVVAAAAVVLAEYFP